MGNLYYASYKYKHVLQFGTYSYLNLPHNHPNKTMIDIIGVITPAQKQKITLSGDKMTKIC